MRVGSQLYAPAALLPGKTRYPLYRGLGGPQGRTGQVRKNSPPPEFDPRTVQPVASRYTDWAIPAPFYRHTQFLKIFNEYTQVYFLVFLKYFIYLINARNMEYTTSFCVVQKKPSSFRIISQKNPDKTLTLYWFQIHFNNILAHR
jgi:hypothetical protein